MGYREQHKQALCQRCGTDRLHVARVYEVPHDVHLVAFVGLGAVSICLFWPLFLLALIWLGVWFAHYVVASIPVRVPYRCTQCGHREADRTAERYQEIRAEWELRQAQKAVQREAQRPHLEEIRRGRARRRRELASKCWEACKSIPWVIDDGVMGIVGEDNTILHWFLLAVLATLTAACCVGAAYRVFSG